MSGKSVVCVTGWLKVGYDVGGRVRLNGEHLIRLALEDSKGNYLDGFWRWVGVLAGGDYGRAVEALYWPRGAGWTPGELERRVTTFFGGGEPWFVVVPNDRLVGVVNDGAECELGRGGGGGWLMAQVPLTTRPGDPKDDRIPLMGLATSFFIREYEGAYVLEFEMFHA